MSRDQNNPPKKQNGAPSRRSMSLSPRRVDPLATDPLSGKSLSGKSLSGKPLAVGQPLGGNPARSTATLAPPPVPSLETASWRERLGQYQWLHNWKLWLMLGVFTCTGTGVFALAVLLRLPGLPNCPAIFWPLASASMRMQCAQIAASKQTAKDLLEAIQLVDSLPADHPLRQEADRLVELWSTDVLNLAEELFQSGKLKEAIEDAHRIPTKASAYKLVEERIQRWQKIWDKAETLYKKAEDSLRKMDWREAFSFAVRLTDSDNRYWQTTKYQELSTRITQTREDGSKLGRAERLAEEGGGDNLLEAIKLAQAISPDSLLYKRAQDLLPKFGNKLLDVAEYRLDKRDLDGALAILNKLPDIGDLKEKSQDLTILANAQSQVWKDSVPSLEDAIAQAQRIGRDRPLYGKAQKLIVRWQQEIEALATLEKARSLAQGGSNSDLSAAIAQTAQISTSNPRWGQVNKETQAWTERVQTTEDRPILDQATAVAAAGDVNALQAAIQIASQIRPGRALYAEAQGKVADWTGQIQRYQDQPTLDRAREQAGMGDLDGAIATASAIANGRSLYADAQADIRDWRKRTQAQTTAAADQSTLQQARQAASAGSADALARAIQIANQVAAGSPQRSEAEGAIADWSNQLLSLAENQAAYDLPGAINLAQRIPAGTPAYSQAQARIQTWKTSRGQ